MPTFKTHGAFQRCFNVVEVVDKMLSYMKRWTNTRIPFINFDVLFQVKLSNIVEEAKKKKPLRSSLTLFSTGRKLGKAAFSSHGSSRLLCLKGQEKMWLNTKSIGVVTALCSAGHECSLNSLMSNKILRDLKGLDTWLSAEAHQSWSGELWWNFLQKRIKAPRHIDWNLCAELPGSLFVMFSTVEEWKVITNTLIADVHW